MIVTIDPGLRGCGCAAWTEGGELVRAAYVVGEKEVSTSIGWTVRVMAWAVEEWLSKEPLDRLIIERPQTYRGRAARGDANDLLDVSLVVGALSLLSSCPLDLVYPAQWKGNTPKHATEARARKKLGDLAVRVDLSCGKKLAPNVWDSVGIGFWHFREVNNRIDKSAPIEHG